MTSVSSLMDVFLTETEVCVCVREEEGEGCVVMGLWRLS